MLKAAVVGVAFATYLAMQARRAREAAVSPASDLAAALNHWRAAVRVGIAHRDGSEPPAELPFGHVTADNAVRSYSLAFALSHGVDGVELPADAAAFASFLPEATRRILAGGAPELLERIQPSPIIVGDWRYSISARHPTWEPVPDGRLPATCEGPGCIPAHWRRDEIVRRRA
jgi:hypothetical protein